MYGFRDLRSLLQTLRRQAVSPFWLIWLSYLILQGHVDTLTKGLTTDYQQAVRAVKSTSLPATPRKPRWRWLFKYIYLLQRLWRNKQGLTLICSTCGCNMRKEQVWYGKSSASQPTSQPALYLYCLLQYMHHHQNTWVCCWASKLCIVPVVMSCCNNK